MMCEICLKKLSNFFGKLKFGKNLNKNNTQSLLENLDLNLDQKSG